MKCNIEWLSAYLDGALAEEKRAKLEEHLKTCEACAAKLEEFARVEQAAKKIPAPQLSEAYWENFASRVQNKLAIREKQRTSPGWLEALKSFFQPTTGKLAIAGSVAVIILLTFVSLDQWKKESFRPPVFEDEKLVMERKADSVQTQAKDESEFQTVEKDNKTGLVEDKRLNQPARERGTATLSQKPAENRPAVSVPLGKASAAPEGQKSKEEPSLAAGREQDVSLSGDFAPTEKGGKSEARKEVSASQVKVAAEEIETLQTQKRTSAPSLGIRARVPSDTVRMKEDTILKSKLSDTGIQEYSLIKGGVDAQYGSGSTKFQKPESLTSIQEFIFSPGGRAHQVILRDSISNTEQLLSDSLHKDSLESIYILLGRQYLHLYMLSAKSKDWEAANRQLNKFLKKELSDSTRQKLFQIRGELKKLKK